MAGFATVMAANHNRYKVAVHEANHPHAEHWVADLVDSGAADYHSVRDLPAGDLLVAGVTCTNHTIANSRRAYATGISLFDLDDPDYDARVTRSERDRATANCVLAYAHQHRPRLILVECTTELASWGKAVPGKTKIGDGTTYRWWLGEFTKLGYRRRVLYLNSMFFGVPQSRDRLYIVFWDKAIPDPDLDHRPPSWCARCSTVVEAVWSWKTGIPPTGSVRYGRQYTYRCPACRCEVVPPSTPSLAAIDLSTLGTRIGDRDKPLAAATMARAERCRQRFADFPAVFMPVKSRRGTERHLCQPLATQTSQQETALLSTGEITPTVWSPLERTGSGGLGVLSTGVMPFRRNTNPAVHVEAMPTITSEQVPGLLTAAGRVQCNGSLEEAKYRSYSLGRPLGTVVGSAVTQGLLFSGWSKHNGSTGAETVAHPVSDPLGTLTTRDTTSLLFAHWREQLADLPLEDCFFRMMRAHEIGRGCGFDVPWPDQPGSFVVWGSTRAQVDGFGNAVSPAVGEWIGARLSTALHAGSRSTGHRCEVRPRVGV